MHRFFGFALGCVIILATFAACGGGLEKSRGSTTPSAETPPEQAPSPTQLYVVPESEAVSFISVQLPSGEVIVPLSKEAQYWEETNTLSWRDTRSRGFVIYYQAPHFKIEVEAHPNTAWQKLDAQLNTAPDGYPCTKYFLLLINKGEELTVLPSQQAPQLIPGSWQWWPYGSQGSQTAPAADMTIVVYNSPCVLHFMATIWSGIRWGNPEDFCQFEEWLQRYYVEDLVANVLRQWWKDVGTTQDCNS